MPKINQEEYEVLKEAQEEGYKWIARNYNGALIIYTSKPMKNPNLYWDSFGERMDDRLFQFIQWEDEPYKIAELIEEYENSPEYVTYISNERTRILSNDLWSKLESEETEVKKDIEWLSQWIEEYENEVIKVIEKRKDEKDEVDGFITTLSRGKQSAIKRIKQKINQLDEPETLSQEWIEGNSYGAFELEGTLDDLDEKFVSEYDLQNLLVPKQELPVIPKFVAEWIKEMKQEERPLYSIMSTLMNKTNHKWFVWKNANKNFSEIVAQAWLAYPNIEIEQEPRYYAKIKGHENIASNDKYWNYNTDMEELSIGDSEVHPNVISEYMLKATKDEWANLGITDDNADFVKIEELEEC